MKAPLSWLKDYVDIDISPEELEEKLFSCGFEVEELIYIGKDIEGVVVGEVTECEPVEGTHLHVCKVDCGEHGLLQICCGADNVKKGIKAPVALVGAKVYSTSRDHLTVEGVMTIKKGKLRGIESEGMLCSGLEIGVSGDMFEGADCNGLLLLPVEWKNGQDVKPLLGLDDCVFDISVTANRPDCQSILGIAREVAALLGKKVKEPDLTFEEGSADGVKLEICDEAEELCPRYIGRYVKDIKINPSPISIRRKLALCGIRPINNIVDITNFVLLEMGQPMHAFDYEKLQGGKIVIRRAQKDEKIVTLDEREFCLNSENLVICDSRKPCALAGIMGGLDSGITDGTASAVFEAAKFARDNIRRTARGLGQHSDSSAIFEKGVNEYTTARAMARAMHLIEQLGCGKPTSLCVDVKTAYSHSGRKHMTADIEKINSLLGIKVPQNEIVKILENLSFGVEICGNVLSLSVPEWREDIDLEPDIAEEVIRFYGYDNIKGTFMESAAVTNGGYSDSQKTELRIKRALSGAGLCEMSTYSFYSPKDLDLLKIEQNSPLRQTIKILNPISEELSVMRTTLAPSLLQVIVRNLRRGNAEGGVYELAKTYRAKELPLKDFPEEHLNLCIGIWGKRDFFELKGYVETIADVLNLKFEYVPAKREFLHPGVTAAVMLDGEEVGYLGMLNPKISAELALERDAFLAELDYEKIVNCAKPFKYSPLPKFAVETRDLALVCDKNLTCGEIEKAIYGACKYVTGVKLFDVYEGEQVGAGKKSMAFTVTFTPKDEEITDKIDGFVKKILGNLKHNLGAELR